MPSLPPEPKPQMPDPTQAERWESLLQELRELNAKLEYVRLMLRLGVPRR
jgi:hypothetical protein